MWWLRNDSLMWKMNKVASGLKTMKVRKVVWTQSSKLSCWCWRFFFQCFHLPDWFLIWKKDSCAGMNIDNDFLKVDAVIKANHSIKLFSKKKSRVKNELKGRARKITVIWLCRLYLGSFPIHKFGLFWWRCDSDLVFKLEFNKNHIKILNLFSLIWKSKKN